MLVIAITAFAFLSVGFATTFWPRRVQHVAVRLYEKIGFWPYSALARGMKPDVHIVQLRIIGLVCLPVGVLCTWILSVIAVRSRFP